MAPRTTPPELPGFTYLDWLGGGGFADVFCYQDGLGRRVAVKVLHGTGGSAFNAEANLMAKLSSHPNIVTVFYSGVAADGRPFLVMEECGTAHLGARIAKRLLTVSKAMEITIQVAGAVETAHRMGILHRDIKPANVLFTDFGRPALTDFGISVDGDTQAANNALSRLWAPQEQYPDSGMAMGPWSDVFSLAATMWAMLVGRSPLEEPGGANDRLSLRHRARTFVPRPTGRQDVPEALERILATALARDPQQRYQSVLDFARALQGVQGQLNDSVTPIDVLSEHVEEDLADDTELNEAGTRISGFMLIDPDRSGDRTATGTGPSSGITSPVDFSGPQFSGPQRELVLPAHVAPHGRGTAAPGLRDFTGPEAPQLADHTVAEGQGIDASTPSGGGARKRRGPVVALVAGLILVVAAALSVPYLLDDQPSDAGSQPTMLISVGAQDPLVGHIAPVKDLTCVPEGESVTCEWTNPEPQEGDKYTVVELLTEEQTPRFVEEPHATVSAQPGQTCVEVSVWRSGQVSKEERKCVDS
ncbi:MAG TPA: serine/threonine-protein kinase [Arachnia sp.]|nr:serine/threonine-protein kinase [Arachnia sp.]HMT85911.1 serine/threonine-protein kinase [Arachnia sp.]